MLLLGPLGIVSTVLLVAGIWKVVRPAPARAALRSLGWAVPSPVVRVLGVTEGALAVAVLLVGGAALALLVGVLYLSFAAVAWRLRGGDVGCGCFGAASSTPPGSLHIAVNLLAAGVAASAAIDGVPGHVAAWHALPAWGVPHALLVVVGATATLGLLTVLPDARAAARGAARLPQPVLFQPGRRAR
jgi:methylamine utilization protein MauE